MSALKEVCKDINTGYFLNTGGDNFLALIHFMAKSEIIV